MRYFYDTEFLEDGRTIDLISIGIVAEDGREYYAVSKDITRRPLQRRIRRHEWLMDNVVPSLPKPHGDWNLHMPKAWLFDYVSPLVKDRTRIADEVRDFLLAGDEPELWADYAAYDHVVFCQLWGTMMDLPNGIPMYTNDIQQLIKSVGLAPGDVEKQESGHHNALADARHALAQWLYLDAYKQAREN